MYFTRLHSLQPVADSVYHAATIGNNARSERCNNILDGKIGLWGTIRGQGVVQGTDRGMLEGNECNQIHTDMIPIPEHMIIYNTYRIHDTYRIHTEYINDTYRIHDNR